MRGKLQTAAGVAAALLTVTGTASAQGSYGDFTFDLGTQQPGASATLKFDVAYRNPSDPNGKPPHRAPAVDARRAARRAHLGQGHRDHRRPGGLHDGAADVSLGWLALRRVVRVPRRGEAGDRAHAAMQRSSRRAKTDASGRARITTTVHRAGLLPVNVSKRGCRTARGQVTVARR